jgi:DNA (cytosine-5)-methyltransferase 1
MKVLTVCSGIGAPECAWAPLGFEFVAQSEIDAFPSAVLAHRFPGVPNWGDMTKWKEWPDADVDVLVGGTPCQSFSVAGLRAGLADPRGNLALTYLAIADRYRPEWLVWENVPGVLSSGGGRDFGSFLGALVKLGYGFAYRVLDAQYFGVAQRRRRVFVVGCLGGWHRAAAVLFERESLQRDHPPSRGAGQIAPTIPSRSSGGGGLGTDFDCDGGLIPDIVPQAMSAKWSKGTSGPAGDEHHNLIPVLSHALRGEGFDASEDGTGRGTPLVPVSYRTSGNCGARTNRSTSVQDAECGHRVTQAPARFSGCQPVALQEVGKRTGASTTDRRAGVGISEPGDPMFTLQAGAQHGVALAVHENQRAEISVSDTAGSLKTSGGKPGQGYPAAFIGSAVRRLTPRECERLQGFPDGWTAIKHRKKPAADGPRYKALGNSMAVPVLRWIGERIMWIGQMTDREGEL